MGAFLVISSVISLVGMGYGLYMLSQQKGMEPTGANLEPVSEYNVTTVAEGVIVPSIYGRIKLTGNIIFYGNYSNKTNYKTVTYEVPSTFGGSKTKHKQVPQSLTYYLSVWEVLCKGPAISLKTWVNDKEEDNPDDIGEIYGTGVDNPDVEQEEVTKLEGLAWIYMPKLNLGENTTSVQTIHFLMESTPTIPFNGNKTCSNGVNPAYIVWSLLFEAGANKSDMDEQSFIDASTYWNSKDYGLNIAINAQAELRNHISKVLSYVSGYFGVNSQNKFIIRAFDPDEESVKSLTKNDFIDFQISRKTWEDTYNVFTGNYIDEEQDYTKRTVSIVNTGNLNIQGFAKPKSINLSAFRTRESAESRLWEIMKQESYPSATISFTTFLHQAELEIGDIVTLSNSDYDLDAAYYRIISKALKEIDKNQIMWVAQQVTERVFDGNYAATTGSDWVPPIIAPQPPENQRVFELPFTSFTGDGSAFLLLSTKGSSAEVGFNVLTSNTSGANYVNNETSNGTSIYGTLQEDYPSSTYEIDDERGILFYTEKSLFEYDDVSRTVLFTETRFALLDDEIVTFQTVTPEGEAGNYRLGGIIRSVYNTNKTTHLTASGIWLFKITDNTYTSENTNFYIKMVPTTATVSYDEALTPEYYVQGTSKSKLPNDIVRITAFRSGVNVDIRWWNVTKYYQAAGTFDPGSTVDTTWALTDYDPFKMDGFFRYRIDGGAWQPETYPYEYTDTEVFHAQATAFTFEVQEVVNQEYGTIKLLNVGAEDGPHGS